MDHSLYVLFLTTITDIVLDYLLPNVRTVGRAVPRMINLRSGRMSVGSNRKVVVMNLELQLYCAVKYITLDATAATGYRRTWPREGKYR
jgi:hypothetical protein